MMRFCWKKVIFCELHLRYGLFLEDSVDYGAPSPALWTYEMFSKVSHPRWSIKQAWTFWKRTIFWTSTLNYGTVFIKKIFLATSAIWNIFKWFPCVQWFLDGGISLCDGFYGIPPTMNNETADRFTKKNGKHDTDSRVMKLFIIILHRKLID